MIRNRNAIRLLCLFCLLVYPAINANLEAQTIIGQRNDSLALTFVRAISSPPIVFCKETICSKRKSTNRFLSISSTLSDLAKNPISAGSFLIPIRALAFPTRPSLVPLNWEIRCRYTLFRGHVSRNCRPVYRSITNGTSELLLAGGNMTNYPIRKTC